MMLNFQKIFIALAFFTSSVLAVPQPLTDVIVSAYLGRWYQMYASFTVKYGFELGGNCVTADYGLTEVMETISVRNTVRLVTDRDTLFPSIFNGNIEINGFAVQSFDIPGALSVSLGPETELENVSFTDPGNYWIIALGPILEGDEKYEWAVVSGPSQNQLYILARNPEAFVEFYEEQVLDMVEGMGFTRFWNYPLPTNQEGCNYEDELNEEESPENEDGAAVEFKGFD